MKIIHLDVKHILLLLFCVYKIFYVVDV